MGSIQVGSNVFNLEVLDQNNYEMWRLRLKTYLMSEDLWDVVKEITEPPKAEDDEAGFKIWAKRNAKALYTIHSSCGSGMFPFIRKTESAKTAWKTLEKECRVSQGFDENNSDHFERCKSFHRYVMSGDWDEAKECLGDVDICSVLVRAVDAFTLIDGAIPLHVAAWEGHTHIVKDLVILMKQEDLKTKTNLGYTALHLAACKGHVHVVKELPVASMGGVQDMDGDTVLHEAVHKGKLDVLKELASLMRQEDLKIKNHSGHTALHLAMNKGDIPMVKILVALMGEAQDNVGDTALHIAVKEGQLNVVKELVLLMRKEDLKIKNHGGYTALRLAVNKGDIHIVKEFVTTKAGNYGENETERYQYLLFTDCIRAGDWDKAKKCLEKLGGDPCNAVTAIDPEQDCRQNALYYAAATGDLKSVRGMLSLLKMRHEYLELKTTENFSSFGSGITLEVSEETLMEKATYMVEQYEKTIGTCLEIQNSDRETPLIGALLNKHGEIARELAQSMRPEGLEIKDISCWNALHLATAHGDMHSIKMLISLMRPEALLEKDDSGQTVLTAAIGSLKEGDVIEMVKYMVEKNVEVIWAPSNNGDIPLTNAARWRKWELVRYLYSLTPIEHLNGESGSEFICYCLPNSKNIDLVWHLLHHNPKLALLKFGNRSPMLLLSRLRYAFLSGSQLMWWQRQIYSRIHIGELAPVNLRDISINVASVEDHHQNKRDYVSRAIYLFRRFAEGLRKLCGISSVYEMKWTHRRIFEILKCMAEVTKHTVNNRLSQDQRNTIKISISNSIQQGYFEFVTHMFKENPKLLEPYSVDDLRGKGTFHFAIEFRQKEVYSLIHEINEKEQRNLALVPVNGHNLLHCAANLSSLPQFDNILDAALQMQRELQWFKEVESFVPTELFDQRDSSNDMTPRELFTKNHKTLLEEAEISIKGTATSCTVVGGLIITMVFAAAFTVPGGNDGATGRPLFLNHKLFKVYIVSDTISLASSTSSVITFLGMLMSRYAENDFLKSLPTKMLVGLITLFCAIVSMVIAFSCAIILMLDGEAWIVALSISFTSLPVILFVWLLFPLLINIFKSTYRPGLFHKKKK